MTDAATSQTASRAKAASSLSGWVARLAVSAVVLAIAFLLDGPIDAALQVHSPGAVRAFARWLTIWGDWWVAGLAGAALCLALFFMGRPKHARSVVVITLAGLATGLTGSLLRNVIGRARPNAAAAQGFYGPWHDGHWVIGKYAFASFPSGHAATLIGLTVAAWTVNRSVAVLIGVFAALVSWSRIAQSSHHFSDIVASALLALWLTPFLTRRFNAFASRLLNRPSASPAEN